MSDHTLRPADPSPNIAFAALLSVAQCEDLDKTYPQWRERRRIAIALLARSGRYLTDMFDRDPNRLRTLSATRRSVSEYRSHLLQAVKIADMAIERLDNVEAYLALHVQRDKQHTEETTYG